MMMESTYGTINNNNGQACSQFGYGKCQQPASVLLNISNSASPLLQGGNANLSPKNTVKTSAYSAHRSSILFAIFVASYLMFVCTGAAIYQVLETPAEQTTLDLMQNARVKLLQKYPQIQDDLNDFEKILKLANGITNYSTYNGSYESNWTMGKSVFFVGTLLTTIGYGHVTPQTVAGKVFTIAFATMGIPMTLVLLSAFVERLFVIVMTFLLWLKRRLCHVCHPLMIRFIHLAFMLFFMVATFLFLPAVIISRIEADWTFLDSLYYCFISLTTIGLGDYIPGDAMDQENRDLYKIAVTVYLYAGITLMMLTLAIFYDIPEINIGRLFTPLDKKENVSGRSCDKATANAERSEKRLKAEMGHDKLMVKNTLSRATFNGLDQRNGKPVLTAPQMSSATLLKSFR